MQTLLHWTEEGFVTKDKLPQAMQWIDPPQKYFIFLLISSIILYLSNGDFFVESVTGG